MQAAARALFTEARRVLARWPYTTLLGALVLALVFVTLLGQPAWVQVVQQVVLATLVYGAAVASHARRSIRRLVATLVSLWIMVVLIQAATPPIDALDAIGVGVSMAVGLTTLLVTVRALFNERGRGADALAGAAFGYLLLSVVWAQLYVQMELIDPGSFNLLADGSTPEGQLFYFSAATLTTLGYGDITPASPLARLFAGIEAMQGTLYIAIFIGRVLVLANMEPTPAERAAEHARTRGPSGPLP